MASKTVKNNDNVLSIRDHNFFKKEKPPMRSGGVRCSCMCSVARADSCDKLSIKDIVTWQQTVLADFEWIKKREPRPMGDSPLWAELESKVRAVMGWVLCDKHQSQLNMSVRTTMDSLKEACGPPALNDATLPKTERNAANNHATSHLTSPASYSPFVNNKASTMPSSPPSLTDDFDPINDILGAPRSSHINAHQALPNITPHSSPSTRTHASTHLATPPLSPAAPAPHPMVQPITINNNNTTYVYPVTPQQGTTTQPLATTAGHATEAQSILQAQVKPEVDCDSIKQQVSTNFTGRRTTRKDDCDPQPAVPRPPHSFGVCERTKSNASTVQPGHPQSLSGESPLLTKYNVTPTGTDSMPSYKEWLDAQKEIQALRLREKYLQEDFQELKVAFHTNDDRLSESESKRHDLESRTRNLDLELQTVTLLIGKLQIDNARLRSQGRDQGSAAEDENDEDSDGIL